jgi:hypothetical protein
MLSGLETSLAVFAIGGAFLSLEVFELPYVLVLAAAQLVAIQRTAHMATKADEKEPPHPAETRRAGTNPDWRPPANRSESGRAPLARGR